MKYEMKMPLFLDGAFGTYYHKLTNDSEPCEYANLRNPEIVKQIHQEYLAAGATAITTNTFGLNPAQVETPEELRKLVSAGWDLAKQAAAAHEKPVQIFADIGVIEHEHPAEQYLHMAQLFIELGATSFLFETLPSLEEILPALQLIKEQLPESFIMVSFAVSQEGYTRKGIAYQPLLKSAWDCDLVDATGMNCACGPSHMLQLMQALTLPEKPFCAMPNAGYPSMHNGRMVFVDNSEYFARKIRQLYQNGASILGGCCGTTPRHIQAAITGLLSSIDETIPESSKRTAATQTKPQFVPIEHKTHKRILVEIAPPMDSDISFMLDAAAQFQSVGADFITVPDSPLCKTRVDSIIASAKIKREVGIDVIPHLACRDKNHIALKASLLGACMEDIRHVLAITGDPPAQTELRKTKGVFSFNSYNLISFITGMNADVFAHAPFTVSGALNVNAHNFDMELERGRRKLANGATWLMTQPIFHQEAQENFLRAKRELDCTLIAGILPVAGYKNAVFLVNEVAGIEIPPEMIAKLEGTTPEEAAEISLDYSSSIASAVFDAADGFYIMMPLKKVEIVKNLVKKIRSMEQ